MRFKHHIKSSKAGIEEINVAPLIDVIFQLLIFFMLSSSFTFQSGIHVKLPKAVTSDILQEENLIISITSEDVIYLNNTVYTTRELDKEIRQAVKNNRPILIKADRRASMGRIVDIWDLCRKMGAERINIATNKDQ